MACYEVLARSLSKQIKNMKKTDKELEAMKRAAKAQDKKKVENSAAPTEMRNGKLVERAINTRSIEDVLTPEKRAKLGIQTEKR